MKDKELQEQLKQWPDDLEIRLGNFYENVFYVKRKTVSVNHKKADVICISEDFDYDE